MGNKIVNMYTGKPTNAVVPGFRTPKNAMQALGLEAMLNHGKIPFGKLPLIHVSDGRVYQEVRVGKVSVVQEVPSELLTNISDLILSKLSYCRNPIGDIGNVADTDTRRDKSYQQDSVKDNYAKSGNNNRLSKGVRTAAGLLLTLAACNNNKSNIPRPAGSPTNAQIVEYLAAKEQEDGKWVYSVNKDGNGIVTDETGQKTSVKSQIQHRFYMGDGVPTLDNLGKPINPTITYAPLEHKAYYIDINGQLKEVREEALKNAEFFAAYTLAKHPTTGVFSLQGTVEQLLLFFHKLDDDKIELNNAEGLAGNATTYPDGFTYDPNTGRFYTAFTKSNGTVGSQEYQIVPSVGGVTVKQNIEEYKKLDLELRTSYNLYLLNLGLNPEDIANLPKALRDPNRLYIFLPK